MVTYRLTFWPASYKNTELFLDADSEADSREAFLDYMFDPDNYYDDDAVMPVSEDEIEILDIKATGQ
jgi:hypothetical protein